MSFPRYPAYKDSGVEWLGDYPTHWQAKPLWTLFRRVKRQGHEGEELLSVYRDHGVVPKSSRDDNFNKPSDDLSAYQLVEVEDLAINKMKAWQGSVAISQHKGIVSPAYHVLTRIHQQNSSYLHHLMRSDRYITGYLSLSKGIRVNQWDLQPEYHSRMPILLPPLEEQILIGYFLDHETAKIDALIAEQQRLIELLQEKREAVISHAVTKGLNPDAPMKHSGVEWLGDVPEHWVVCNFQRFVQIAEGQVDPRQNPYADMPLIAPNHIQAGTGQLLGLETAAEQGAESGKYICNEGDVIYSKIRPSLRKACIAPCACLTSADMYPLRAHGRLSNEFLFRFLLSEQFSALAIVESERVAMPKINRDSLKSVALAIPPKSEQEDICLSIRVHSRTFDALIAAGQEAIVLLSERRSALISATVTGQIDVRGLVPEGEAA